MHHPSVLIMTQNMSIYSVFFFLMPFGQVCGSLSPFFFCIDRNPASTATLWCPRPLWARNGTNSLGCGAPLGCGGVGKSAFGALWRWSAFSLLDLCLTLEGCSGLGRAVASCLRVCECRERATLSCVCVCARLYIRVSINKCARRLLSVSEFPALVYSEVSEESVH